MDPNEDAALVCDQLQAAFDALADLLAASNPHARGVLSAVTRMQQHLHHATDQPAVIKTDSELQRLAAMWRA